MVSAALSTRPLHCVCGNKIGVRYSDGHVKSQIRGRTIVIYAGVISCEDCDRSTEVEKALTAVLE